MKLWMIFKKHVFFGTLLVLGLVATPLVAGVGLNIFSPGTTISSNDINENFSNLETQINNICQLPGQIIFSGVIRSDALFEDPIFICDGITLTLQDAGTQITADIEGISASDISIHASPRIGTPNYCVASVINSSSFRFECFDIAGMGTNNFVYLTLIRRM